MNILKGLGYLLVQTFCTYAYCHRQSNNDPIIPIVGICGTHVNICTPSDTNPGPIQTFDRYMGMRLWRKAKRMDRSFNTLFAQFRPSAMPPLYTECGSCMETFIPDSLPQGNITAEQMRVSLLTDFEILSKVVGALIRMRDGCTQNESIRHHIVLAENMAKQLLCEIGLSLPSVGGVSSCDPLYPVLTSWCQANNCYEWGERNYLIMDNLIITSQAMKSKYNHLLSSHVIYSNS